MQQPQRDFQVAIVGGGVCGLTCAIALQRAGVPVQLFEAAAAFGEIGAGIGIGPNAIRVLKAIGVWDNIMKNCTPADLGLQGFVYRTGVGEHKAVYTYPVELPEDEGLGIHRATFLDALVGVVDPAICHFKKRCTSVTESPDNPQRLRVHFLDGTSYDADVVLGADGIKSTVRKFVTEDGDDRIAFSNTVAYRGLIPYAQLKAAGFKTDLSAHPSCFMGHNKHFIVFAIKNTEIVNVVAFSARYDIPIGAEKLPAGTPWVELVSRDEVKQVYEGWGPDIAALLECMPEKPSKWSINVVHPPLESYAKKRVALLGDAAHAMLPHLGAGAGQGLEDALLLARLLAHPSTNVDNLESVLQVYSEVRRPRAQMVWEGSRFAGCVYDGNGPHGVDFEKVMEDLSPERLFKPVWRHDIDGDFHDAVKLLREQGAFTDAVA
ncbi:FAD/NAD-P-binding domain-containing protein [Trametes cingulata]|nr:FAD/NAD-P-binding domain-containing protein [Trametes cingulata]